MAFCLGGAILCSTCGRGGGQLGSTLAGSTCSSSGESPSYTWHRTCVAWALQTSITDCLKGITFQCDVLGSLRMGVDGTIGITRPSLDGYVMVGIRKQPGCFFNRRSGTDTLMYIGCSR